MTAVPELELEVAADPGEVAARAAEHVAAGVTTAVADRGHACVAFSGGSTPAAMLAALTRLDVPWTCVDVFQVDERVAPDGHADRNITMLREHLVEGAGLAHHRLRPIPVGEVFDGLDPDLAAARYADELASVCGRPPVLDLVHLGLGDDGHTASLVPGDPAVDVVDRDVAATDIYRGRRRVTLTRPALGRARARLWVVAGASKAAVVAQLVAGDRSIPAGRVERRASVLVADQAAARHLRARRFDPSG